VWYGPSGAFYIMSKGGREEKRVEAHEGAVISLRFNFEGPDLSRPQVTYLLLM